MRVVKTAEERKNEILDVAEQLFAEKGFDNASTNDIIHEIGIARGTLYHHFASKEEILDAIMCAFVFCHNSVSFLKAALPPTVASSVYHRREIFASGFCAFEKTRLKVNGQ